MANSFGQYTGGIQGVQGISEAGANIGKFMQIGLENAGTGIAEGLKSYNENVSKDAILTEQLKGMGQQVLQYHDMFSKNPELRGLADQMQPVLDQFQKAPSMSMSQKQGLLLSGQATLANVVPSYQMQSAMNDANTKRKVAEYDAEIGTYTKNPTAKAAMKEIKSTYNPNISPDQNTANESAEYDKWVASTGKEGLALDRQEYLSAWNKKWARNITDNKELQNKQPDLYNRLVEGFKAQEGYEQNIQTDNSGVTDYSKESDLYNATTTSAVDIINNQLMAKNEKPADIKPLEQNLAEKTASAIDWKTKVTNNSQQAELDLLKLKRQQLLNGATAEELKVTGSSWHSLGEHDYSFFGNLFTGGKTGTKALQKRTEELSKGWTPSNSNVNAYNVVGTIGKGSSIGDVSAAEYNKLTDVEKELLSTEQKRALNGAQTVADEAAGIIEKNGNAGLYDALSKFDNAIKAKETDISKLQTKPVSLEQRISSGALSTQPTPAPMKPVDEVAYQPSNKEDTYLRIGTAYRPERVKIEEKKQQMVDWFKETQGYVPANFDDFFNKTHPEASLQYATTPTGSTVMFTDGKWVELKSDTKNQMTPEQQKVYEGRIKGTVNKETGLLDFEEVGVNTGISLKGIATGSETAVSEFNTLTTQAGTALTNINKLLGMIDKDGKSIMPTMRVEGQRISKFLAANLRPIVYHGARAAAWEEGSLGELATDPTKFWSLDSVNRKSLETVRQAVIDSLKLAAKDHKVEVQVNDASSKEDMKNSVLAMKLEARNKGKTN